MFWEPSNWDAATRATPRRATAREDDDARDDVVVVDAVAGGRTNMTRARVRDDTRNRTGTPSASEEKAPRDSKTIHSIHRDRVVVVVVVVVVVYGWVSSRDRT